ncbi:hypothetical protein ACFSLT_12000 [Novosphingobium resinovorum]
MRGSQAFIDVVGYVQAFEQELLLFVAFWLVVGALDEFAIDLLWIGLRLTGRLRDRTSPRQRWLCHSPVVPPS